MKSIYDVYQVRDGSFVGYAWAGSAEEAISLVVGVEHEDWQFVALTQHGHNAPLAAPATVQ